MKKANRIAVCFICACLSVSGITVSAHGHGNGHHNGDNCQSYSNSCPNDNCPNDNCPNDNCPNDNCPNDNCPNDNCPNSVIDTSRLYGGKKTSVTLSQAKKTALEDAGVTSKDAVFTKAKTEYDDGEKVYEIKFRAGSMKYEYEIRASDGKILEKSSKTIAKTSSSKKKLTLAKAKQIALKDAGFSANDITRFKGELDSDGRIKKYEIEFTADGTEYEYEINAETGEIISKETEKK